MDTDLICRLARHPNIVGVKHTDHDVGRIARETAQSLSNAFGCGYSLRNGTVENVADFLLAQLLSQFWVVLLTIFWALLLLVAKARLPAWPMSLLGSASKLLSSHELADTKKLCSMPERFLLPNGAWARVPSSGPR